MTSSHYIHFRLLAYLFVFIAIAPLKQIFGQENGVKSSSLGHEFYIGFMQNLPESRSFRVIVGTSSATASFTIEGKDGFTMEQETSSLQPTEVVIPTDFAILGNGFSERNKGIRIYSPVEPIFVIAEHFHFDSQPQHSTFLAYPSPSDTYSVYEYYVLSLEEFANSQFLLVGCKDDTSVTIIPSTEISLPQDIHADSDMILLEIGEEYSFTIDKFQSLLIANSADFTGTKIISNKPLTVISGHECAIGSIDFTNCQHLAFQVPISATWGTKFLLAPFAGQSSLQKFRLVSHEPTSVEYNCGSGMLSTFVNTSASLFTDQYCALESQNPILIVQIAIHSDLEDSAIALVSPVDQYVSVSKFAVLAATQFLISRISVTVETEHFSPSNILLDDEQLECEWENILFEDESVGYGCSFIVSTSNLLKYHTVSHSDNGKISVLVYGFSANDVALGYAYLAGQSFTVTNEPNGQFIPVLDLDDFSGVKELDRVADSSSEILLPRRIIFGEETFSTIYVNENGVISFKEPWAFSLPENFPSSNINIRNDFAVAVFWSDNDIRRDGAVRYITYSVDDEDNAQGASLMKFLNEFIQQSLEDGAEPFIGQWLLAAHWDNVHPSPHGEDNRRGISEDILNKTNNYQSIIVTDFIDTYVFNSYDIQWSNVGAGRPAVVGFTAGGRFFDNHPLSGKPEIGCAVNGQICMADNTSTTALLRLPTDSTLQATVQPCVRSYVLDAFTLNQQNPTALRDILDPCPSLRSQAEFDGGRFQPELPDCFVGTRPKHLNGVLFLQQCCYDNTGYLITDPSSGSVGSLLVVGNNDEEFRQQCCSISKHPEYCALFFERRPVISSAGYQALSTVGLGFGDPHYITFDNLPYEFQGIGDYTLLELYQSSEATDPVFTIQGRLGQPDPGWQAEGVSGHVGLAFGDPSFAVHLGSDLGEFRVFRTKPFQEDITSFLSEIPFVLDDRISLIRNNDMLIVFHFDSGIRIEATIYGLPVSPYVNFRAYVPQSYAGLAKGFFGNFDGSKTIDLFTRSGVPVNTTNSRTIYNDMLSWNIDFNFDTNFLFSLPPPARRRRQIVTDDFEPTFIEDLIITDEQRQFCDDHMQCIFDYSVLQDGDVAQNTLQFDLETDIIQEEQDNFPPVITTIDIFSPAIGESQFLILVTDVNGDNFDLTFTGGVVNAVSSLTEVSSGQYSFNIMVSDASKLNVLEPLVFIATDERGAPSELVQRVEVCACVNDGECTSDGIRGIDTTIIQACDCSNGYDGSFCENDKDGCLTAQCSDGTICQDVEAPGSGYICSECLSGYTGDSQKCYDIDECAENNGLCDQTCTNTEGSFFCDCDTGYQLVDGHCEDINECDNFNPCEQLCVNSEGSFSCECSPGFSLASDQIQCDVNPDATCDRDCGHGDCVLVEGSQVCVCGLGYVVDEFGSCLLDRNECDEGACTQECTNLDGSFECSCLEGFQLEADGRTCVDIDECLAAALNGDVVCQDPNTDCYNIEGSHECICVSGFSLLDGSCQHNVCPGLVELEGESISYSLDGTLDGNYLAGTFARYSCDDHYALSGESKIFCEENRLWSGPIPTCDLVMCPELDPIANGAVAFHEDIDPPHDALTEAIYSCTLGYSLTGGDEVRTCEGVVVDGEVVGQWTGLEPTCEVTRCPPLPEIANSNIFYTTIEQDLESFPIRTFGIYFCELNFRGTSGTLARECLSDGSWKGTEPVCSQPGCPDIGDPINGNIVFRTDTTAPFSANTIATYECDQGYKLDSDVSDRICIDDTFVWSGAAFNCIPITCPPLVTGDDTLLVSYNNDADEFGGYEFGTLALFTCLEGYGIVGGASSSCMEDSNGVGAFESYSTTCEPIFCPVYGLRNGHVSYDSAPSDSASVAFGTVVSHACDAGHTLMGDETRKCIGDGSSPQGYFDGEEPLCEEITCPELESPANGGILFSTNLGGPYDLGVTATYSCDDGFVLSEGDPLRVCDHDGVSATGMWSGSALECIGVCQSLGAPQDGEIEYSLVDIGNNEYLAGTIATFLCFDGFELYGHLSRTCQNNMTWSKTTPSCLVSCPGLSDIESGNIDYTTIANADGNFRSGTIISYSCIDDFKIVGLSSRKCEPDMTWSGEDPTCEPITCPDLKDPTDGNIVFKDDPTAPFDLGTIAYYTCYPGFVPDGIDAVRVCLNVGSDIGEWNGTASFCEPVQCIELLAPPGARSIIYDKEPDPGYPFGTIAEYQCIEGYRLVFGHDQRTCEMNGLSTIGVWSAVEPVCERIVPTCPDINNPENGRIVFSNDTVAPFGIGTKALYECDHGYEAREGTAERYCEDNGFNEFGFWTGSAPICVATVLCPALEAPARGSVVYSVDTGIFGYGVTATYSCHEVGEGLSGLDEGTYRICIPPSHTDYSHHNSEIIGVWSEYDPSCKKIECPDIADPINGQVVFSEDRIAPFDYDTTATYSCLPGFELSSLETVRVCGGDGSSVKGKWTGDDYTCV